jgi:hypothetical protein
MAMDCASSRVACCIVLTAASPSSLIELVSEMLDVVGSPACEFTKLHFFTQTRQTKGFNMTHDIIYYPINQGELRCRHCGVAPPPGGFLDSCPSMGSPCCARFPASWNSQRWTSNGLEELNNTSVNRTFNTSAKSSNPTRKVSFVDTESNCDGQQPHIQHNTKSAKTTLPAEAFLSPTLVLTMKRQGWSLVRWNMNTYLLPPSSVSKLKQMGRRIRDVRVNTDLTGLHENEEFFGSNDSLTSFIKQQT